MTQTVDYLGKLIEFPTVNANSNLPMIAFLREFLEKRGFDIYQIDDPDEEKAGLFASIGPPVEGGVLLSGHTDVVPTEGQKWSYPEFTMTQVGDRVYGRGTTDMKGFVASMLTAADIASKTRLKKPLKLSLSYDEEIGCVGIKHMIDQLAETIGKPAFAIVGEPTSMNIAIGHKGKSAIRAICKGDNGHSALAPNFVNALHVASDFVTALRELQIELSVRGAQDDAYTVPYSTVHVGKLTGGMALNMVPPEAVIDFEFRHLATDKSEDLMGTISELAQKIEAQHKELSPNAEIILESMNSYPGLDTPEDHDIVGQMQRLSDNSTTTKVGYGTEAGYFSGLGVPTIVCGPGSMQEQGHKPDEYIMLEQLNLCDNMMQKLIRTLAV